MTTTTTRQIANTEHSIEEVYTINTASLGELANEISALAKKVKIENLSKINFYPDHFHNSYTFTFTSITSKKNEELEKAKTLLESNGYAVWKMNFEASKIKPLNLSTLSLPSFPFADSNASPLQPLPVEKIKSLYK
jgi:hypothetical protein